MKKENPAKCKCPFCEKELILKCFEPIFCKPCKIKFVVCKKCGQLFNEKLKECPKCEGKNE